MTKVSKATAEKSDIGAGDVYEQIVDGYEITILDLREETDMAPLLRGLPDDVCPCEHWGYVVRGRVTFTFADHVEVFEAGDAFRVLRRPQPLDGGRHGVGDLHPEPTRSHPVNEAIERNVAAMQSAVTGYTGTGSSGARSPCRVANRAAAVRVETPILA